MIETDAIHRRGQALEDQYFQRVDQELLKNLQCSLEREKQFDALARATGITDPDVIDHLFQAGIDTTNVAALTLTPLVFVAWASGKVSAEERQGVISAALRRGVDSNPVAFQLLEQWLHARPPRELWSLWKEYATALQESLPAVTTARIRERLMHQSRQVAMASGGVLGIGSICPSEQRVLDEIESVFH